MTYAASTARKRVWDAAPSHDVERDATSDVRAMRQEDARVSDANAEVRMRMVTESQDEAHQLLLEALGL